MPVFETEIIHYYCGECNEVIVKDLTPEKIKVLKDNDIYINYGAHSAVNFKYKCDECGVLLSNKIFEGFHELRICKDDNFHIVNDSPIEVYCNECYEEYKEEEE